MIEATIHGNTPSKSNCYKIITLGSKERRYSSLGKTKVLKTYEDQFFIQLPPKLRNLDIAGYFEFEIDVFYPSQRADLDNSLKIVLDCLQMTKTIRNDNKCVRIVANKALDKTNPRIEFKIIEL
tara:strand:+ start:791 stop:1162 length:372 start_codon:yes stop_codon:yes gene_type:complete